MYSSNKQHLFMPITYLLIAVVLLAACQSPLGGGSTASAPAPAVTRESNNSQGRSAIQAAPSNTGSGRQGNSPTGAATTVPTSTRGISATINLAVDGALALATPLVTVSFESSGKVTAVNVRPGQAVKKGDVLAELDGADLKAALQKAQDALSLQQAQIDKSMAPSKPADIDNAKAALSSAYAAYNDLVKGPNPHDVEQALLSWNQAKDSLYSAQLGRDAACHIQGNTQLQLRPGDQLNPYDCKRQQLSVQSSEMSERTAYQNYLTAQQPASADKLASSWSSVVQSQNTLAGLQNNVSAEQKTVYEAQLQQASVAVTRAQRNLAQARLLSPCECVVQDVTLSLGTNSSGNITLLDLAQLKFQTSNLSEQDVAKVKPGQAVTIRLKAFSQPFGGKVDVVLPVSSGTLGTIALFTALLDVDPTDAPLRPGMTGQAQISLR